jgi:hypothetical protein
MTAAPGVELETFGVPQAVAEAVREVYLETGGQDMVEAVLKRAEDVTSPLHGYFEWSDDVAAQKYRLSQATDLIRRVKVKVIRPDAIEPIRVRAYVANRELTADKSGGTPAGSYTAIEEVSGGTAAELMLLDSIERDVHRLRAKYRAVADFIDVVSDILKSED